MSSIALEGSQLVYLEEQKRVVLLNIFDFMANKSRFPMHSLTDSGLTIPKLIVELKEKHGYISGETEESVFSAYLLDILLTSCLIRTSAPMKVVEMGATSGVLSYHLATLMGRLNGESHLCCVSNVIGNESENHWLDRISLVEQPPKLSMVVSDYEDTQLQAHLYDIVILNGTVRFDKPYETIREAERLVKTGGVLLCHVKEDPLLESCFKLIFSERQEYEINAQEKILLVTYPGYSWGQEKKPDLNAEISELYEKLHRAVKAEAGPEEIRSYLRRMDECVDQAIEQYDIRRKTELLQLKELVLDYMLNIGEELGEFYREKCLEAVSSVYSKE